MKAVYEIQIDPVAKGNWQHFYNTTAGKWREDLEACRAFHKRFLLPGFFRVVKSEAKTFITKTIFQ